MTGSIGMTLVEVVVSAALLTVLMLGLTATYIANLKNSRTMSYHTQVIATSLSLLERLRSLGYADLELIHRNASASTPATIRVFILDPSFTTSDTTVPPGYRPLDLRLNVKDGVEIDDDWTVTTLVPDANSTVRTPIRFWLSLNHNTSSTAPIRQVIEATLVYRWEPPGVSKRTINGNVRIAIPNPTALLPTSS